MTDYRVAEILERIAKLEEDNGKSLERIARVLEAVAMEHFHMAPVAQHKVEERGDEGALDWDGLPIPPRRR